MRKFARKIMALALALAFIYPAQASDAKKIDAVLAKTAKYVYETVKTPTVASIGGEWAIIGLARSGYNAPKSYFENYYKSVAAYVKEHKGVLHEKKYTEYSRVILGLTAAGYDPRDVAGYDLTEPLGDFEKTVWQGINGPIWALIALDSGNYAIPKNSAAKTQATREMYVDEILRRQLPGGGFNLSAGANGAKIGSSEEPDPDITGMAVQALAKYTGKTKVKQALNKALTSLSKTQDAQGGMGAQGGVESVAQTVIALREAGVSLNDPRFVKNGKTLTDNLTTYQKTDGSFKHTSNDSGNNLMATEQALCALAAVARAAKGESSLYRIKTEKTK
jgi:hypothetical protein